MSSSFWTQWPDMLEQVPYTIRNHGAIASTVHVPYQVLILSLGELGQPSWKRNVHKQARIIV